MFDLGVQQPGAVVDAERTVPQEVGEVVLVLEWNFEIAGVFSRSRKPFGPLGGIGHDRG